MCFFCKLSTCPSSSCDLMPHWEDQFSVVPRLQIQYDNDVYSMQLQFLFFSFLFSFPVAWSFSQGLAYQQHKNVHENSQLKKKKREKLRVCIKQVLTENEQSRLVYRQYYFTRLVFVLINGYYVLNVSINKCICLQQSRQLTVWSINGSTDHPDL